MNILNIPRRFVTSDWGGTETVLLETSRRLNNYGHQTQIMCPDALSNDHTDNIGGIPVKRVPYFYPYFGLTKQARKQMDFCGGNMFSFSLRRELKKETSLDIIHLHTLKRIGGIGRQAALRNGIPYVVTLHGGVTDRPESERNRLITPTRGSLEWGKLLGMWVGSRRVLQDANAIICVSETESNNLKALYPDKQIIHLPNGVDSARFAKGDGRSFRNKFSIPFSANVLLCVGRIDPQKNQQLLINQMPAILEKDPDAHLVLVGHVTDWKYFHIIKQAIAQLGLQNKVSLIPGIAPFSSDLEDCFHAADIFVLPSKHEPFGIVILEAWAAGLPVIASRVGGIINLIKDGEDGLLFNRNNAADFLSTYKQAIANKKRLKNITLAGKQRAVLEFDWDIITNQLMDIYKQLENDRL